MKRIASYPLTRPVTGDPQADPLTPPHSNDERLNRSLEDQVNSRTRFQKTRPKSHLAVLGHFPTINNKIFTEIVENLVEKSAPDTRQATTAGDF